MICFHKYRYIGVVEAKQWLGGVTGGILVNVLVEAKECIKCGDIKEVK